MFTINLSIKKVVPQKYCISHEVTNKRKFILLQCTAHPFPAAHHHFYRGERGSTPGKADTPRLAQRHCKGNGCSQRGGLLAEGVLYGELSNTLTSVGPNCISTAYMCTQGGADIHISRCTLSGQKYDKTVSIHIYHSVMRKAPL